MASFDDLQKAFDNAMPIAMVKYAGGSVRGIGSKKNKAVTGKQAIMNSHFAKTNQRIYAALSEKYAEQKRARVGNKPILVFSGALQKSLIRRAKIKKVSSDTYLMSFPDAVPYAKRHATGGKHLPVRHPTALTAEDKKRFGRVYNEIAREELRALDAVSFA